MATLSRPVGYSSLAVIAVGLLWWSNAEPPKVGKQPDRKPLQSSKPAEPDWSFPPSETAIHFDKPKGTLRNIFNPLVNVDKPASQAAQDELMKLPANMAEGDPNWAYTGMVEVDGARLALLENSATHQGGYVKEGEIWKKSRIVHISVESILVVGPDGSPETIFRYNANQQPKVKPPPDNGFRPMDITPALKGLIGSQIEISRSEGTLNAAPSLGRTPLK
jgi:hypothetical protein